MSKETCKGPYKGISHGGAQIIQGTNNHRGPGGKAKVTKGTDLRSGKK